VQQTHTYSDSPEIVIPTQDECWVLPRNCHLVKLLFEQQALRASDLRFYSDQHRQRFVRQLFLLALQDECETSMPSPLAKFARAIMYTTQNSKYLTTTRI